MVGRVAELARVVSGASAAAVLLLAAGAGPARAAADLSGVWWITTYNSRIAPVNGEPIPFTPAAREKYLAYVAGRQNGQVEDDTGAYCLPDGVVRGSGSPFPFEIRQSGSQVFILYEEDR